MKIKYRIKIRVITLWEISNSKNYCTQNKLKIILTFKKVV